MSSIQYIDVETIVYNNQAASSGSYVYSVANATRSFFVDLRTNLQGLSTTTADSGDIKGLLYVPTLSANDPCNNASSQYVPTNVTRIANIPLVVEGLIALVPWISPDCVLNYLAAANNNAATAVVVFLPGQEAPPTVDNSAWDLGDGGKWKNNDFPVFAIPASEAEILLNESAKYSGSITSAPYGAELAAQYGSSDYARLLMSIDLNGTGGAASLPGLWVVLLIIVAVLLAVLGISSVGMHMVQRKRRENLRRRIISGEVGIEILGIKRLKVPVDMLEKMPLYIYGTNEPVEASTMAARREAANNNNATAAETDTKSADGADSADQARPISAEIPSSLTVADETPTSPTIAAATPTSPKPRTTTAATKSRPLHQPSAMHQPTCAICLDDFVSGESIVRELPCHHIFHSDCVDTFLSDNSSLCPLCKTSALPADYCPAVITNAMVRRERTLRRNRQRAVWAGEFGAAGGGNASNGRSRAVPSRFVGWIRGCRTPNHAAGPTVADPERTGGLQGDAAAGESVEMAQHQPTTTSATAATAESPTTPVPPAMGTTTAVSAQGNVSPPEPPAGASRSARREWARRRALAMLGPQAAPTEADLRRDDSSWRRGVRAVFPGMA